MKKIKILLGGIGDDSHSIGSNLIRIALEEKGYYVNYLGIHNTLNDFINECPDFDIILVSCINGHTELYINDTFEEVKAIKSYPEKLWYLGGNLSVDKTDRYIIQKYKEYGFTRVFPKPIDVEELLEYIEQDIYKMGIFPKLVGKEKPKTVYPELLQIQLQWDKNAFDFMQNRKAVLHEWATGSEVSDERTCKNYQKHRNMDEELWDIDQRGDIAIQPRTGVADLQSQIILLRRLQEHGISIASIQLDAASRQKKFAKAKEGLDYSIQSGSSMLNGFPVPIHGVNGMEQLTDSLDIPFQIRGGAPDHRFVYEVGICGGATGVEGSFLSYILPYQKSMHPTQAIQYWDYVDQLCGRYLEKYHLSINREFFGPLTTTLVAPSIAIVINIIEALFGAERGVRSFSVGVAEQGNRIQDIAAIRVLKELTKAYLEKYHYYNSRVTTVFHQYMGAFPKDPNKAAQLILESAVTAKLSGATRIMTKTAVEAVKIPSVEDNILGVHLVREGIKKASSITIDSKKLTDEINLLRDEVIAIMDYIEKIQYDSIEIKAVQAIQDGVLDIMFSPNCLNQNKLICFRGVDGAIRISNPQRLPFSDAVCKFHKEELAKRMELENDQRMYTLLSKDLTFIWKGEYGKWPLYKG